MDRHAYIPPSVEQAMTKQMQRNMPEHLKKYVGPYMQQQVMHQGMNQPGAGPQATPGFTPHAPTAHLPRPDFLHSEAVAEQPQVEVMGAIVTDPQPATAEPMPTSTYPPGYEFIAEPKKPSSKLWQLPAGGGNSLPKRAALLAGGLLVLVILFIIAKNLIAGSPSYLPFATVVQDQQELIHLSGGGTSTNSQSLQALSTADQNLAATTNVSVNSAQASLIAYLANNKYKLGKTQLNLKISASLDSQLTSAQASGDYDQTFQQIMQTQLNNYANDLQQALKTAGPKGKALLNSDINQQQLLDKQLTAATTSD